MYNQRRIEKNKNEKTHRLDGFLVSPKMLKGMSYYYCGIRGYTSDSFSERWKLVRRAKTLSRQKHIICEGEYIVSKSPINESCRAELGLTEVIEPRDSVRIKAEKRVIMDFVISNLSLPGFHRLGHSNRIRSNNPLSEAGAFQQFMEFNPAILKIGNRNIIRPNPKCVYERTDSCLEQMSQGWSPKNSDKLSYRYQPRTCVFRQITDRTISDPMNESGMTLIEWYVEASQKNPRLKALLPELRRNPDMPVFEVDHDHFNQGKNTKKFHVAAALLSQNITHKDIPDQYRGQFIKNSHVDLSERVQRSMRFIYGIGSEASELIDREPITTQIADLSCQTISEPNLQFGDGSVMLKWDPISNFRTILQKGPFIPTSGVKKIGLVPYDHNNSDFLRFANQSVDFLRKMGCKSNTEVLEPWNSDLRNRASEYILSDQYADLGFDILLVQLNEYSEQNHKAWKRALTRSSVPSQMVATGTFTTFGAPFNVALGLFCGLGGLPFGLKKSYTGNEVWIGMDTWREGRKNVSAASVACDAGGLLIGYPHPMPTAGERTDNKTFLEQLRDSIEGVQHHYRKLSRPLPTKFGLIRDGFFFESMEIVEQVEREYGVEFTVCDIQKFGAPKLAEDKGNLESAEPGTILWHDKQGFIQTTEQRKGRNTGSPNLISVGLKRGKVRMEDLLKDLFWLTNIHAGSTQQPGYPIPQYYAHKIAERSGKGIPFQPGFHTDLGFL